MTFPRRFLSWVCALVLWGSWAAGGAALAQPGGGEGNPSAQPPAAKTVLLRGQVLPLGEALRRIGAAAGDEDQAAGQMVLLDAQGHIHPLLKDARGRGFWKDRRLRGVPLELLVRRRAQSPFVQVIRVFLLKDGKRLEADYWCDICAIVMFELKECECCQGPIRLRLRPVRQSDLPPSVSPAPR